MQGRILVIDDEEEILQLVSLLLTNEGYRVDCCGSSTRGLEMVAKASYHMAIVDIMLPDIDGFELARRLRKITDIPILFLSAKDSPVDKAIGLGIGGDDYLTKPFNSIELVARVKAHLRRYLQQSEMMQDIEYQAGPLRLNEVTHRVWVRDCEINVTATEFELLKLLVANAGKVFTKNQLYLSVWGDSFIDDNTIAVHIRRLRNKIEEDPSNPRLIKTVWGIGYRFEGIAYDG